MQGSGQKRNSVFADRRGSPIPPPPLATAGTMSEVPAGRLEILDDVDVDGRGLVDARYLIGVEVALLDTPVVLRRCRRPQKDWRPRGSLPWHPDFLIPS